NFLGGFGFSNEQCLDSIKYFSGGEKARLALALIVYQKPNLIILDEPTNHLDMETRDALDMALQDFDGALIIVTHDKHMLASIADQFWWVHEGEVSLFMGDLDSYLQARLKTLKQKSSDLKETKPGRSKKEARKEGAIQRKQLDKRLKPITHAIKKLEKQLDKLQAEQAALHEMMEDSALYEAANKDKLAECIKSQSECEQLIESAEMEWMDLEEALEVETQRAEAGLD
ncbi:MAG: ATP-binding cassette domain-containing protein, partial [Gammaproteobacteria bacterium]|nr:ATP-binding cassette domain-containing protein [Gammaproteobacteria bacterium]